MVLILGWASRHLMRISCLSIGLSHGQSSTGGRLRGMMSDIEGMDR